MTPLRIIFLFFSYTFVQRACKPIVMFCQHCPFSARLLLTEAWGAMAQPPLWCPVCFPGSMLQLWVCPLLRLHVKFMHPSARHSFPLDLSQFRRTEMWLRGVIQPVVILYWRVPFTGLASRLITSLASATDVTARLCCHFIKLVPAEPSIP